MLLFSMSRHAAFIAIICLATISLNAQRACADGVEVDKEDDSVVTVDEGEEEEVVYTTPALPGGKERNSIYLAEHFDNVAEFRRRWVQSEAKKEGIDDTIAKYDGEWNVEAAQRNALRGDLGLVLKSKAKHSAIAAALSRPFAFDEKPLVVQYEVLLQQGQECGGAYLKLLSAPTAPAALKLFHDKTPYTIMFGPDKCGNDYKLHFIFRHKNPLNGSMSEKHCKKPKERIEDQFTDKLPHLYTLIVRPDNTFQIYIDHKVVNEGSLLEDFTPAVNPAEEIDDPEDVRPADWDDRERIPDASAVKPDDWDESQPQHIPDPDARKPDNWLDDEPTNIPDPQAEKPADWDEDMDGEWEAPLVPNPLCEEAGGCGEWVPPEIPNPLYKGKWRPPLVDNPNYQGKWAPRRIPNPDYFEDREPFKMASIGAVGLELWSMSNDILFDNFLVTDDPALADAYAQQTFDLKRRKMDKVAVSMWGRVMRSINYKPGWWSIYFIYCSIPIIIYGYYLWTRVREESVFGAALRYTNEHPWLWAVYVVAIVLPIVLVLVFCCGGQSSSSTQESEEQERAAAAKKTDAVQPDDDAVDAAPAAAAEGGEEDDDEEEEEEDDEEVEDEEVGEGGAASRKDPEGKEEKEEDGLGEGKGSGDAPSSPRKRKTRKD